MRSLYVFVAFKFKKYLTYICNYDIIILILDPRIIEDSIVNSACKKLGAIAHKSRLFGI